MAAARVERCVWRFLASKNKQKTCIFREYSIFKVNVCKNQTKSEKCGKPQKIDSAHTFCIGRVECAEKPYVVGLAKY